MIQSVYLSDSVFFLKANQNMVSKLTYAGSDQGLPAAAKLLLKSSKREEKDDRQAVAHQ